MSLILDALKRAERERRLGQAPDALDELPTPPPPPPEKQRRWRGFAIAAAVAVAVLVLLAVWRIGAGPADSIETPVAVAPAAAPATTEAAVLDEEQPAVDPVVSARIEDEGGIASLDDLTGDSPADGREPAEDPEPEAPVAAAPQPAPPGPTLYTPSRRPALAPADPPPPAPVAVAAAAPPPRPAPAPAPAPPPEVSQIVLDPPPPRPYAQPPGPIVRFGADGSNQVIPGEPSTPEPSAAAATPAPAPAAVAPAPEPAAAAAKASAPAPSPADLPVLVEPAKPLYVEPSSANPAATVTEATPAPAPPPKPVARRPSPPPAPAPSTVGLPRLRDMPPAYRAGFPALSVDVHVYNTDPARRFVLINGRRYVEASALSEGPQIVEIVPDGMVLDWRNERIFYTLGR